MGVWVSEPIPGHSGWFLAIIAPASIHCGYRFCTGFNIITGFVSVLNRFLGLPHGLFGPVRLFSGLATDSLKNLVKHPCSDLHTTELGVLCGKQAR